MPQYTQDTRLGGATQLRLALSQLVPSSTIFFDRIAGCTSSGGNNFRRERLLIFASGCYLVLSQVYKRHPHKILFTPADVWIHLSPLPPSHPSPYLPSAKDRETLGAVVKLMRAPVQAIQVRSLWVAKSNTFAAHLMQGRPGSEVEELNSTVCLEIIPQLVIPFSRLLLCILFPFLSRNAVSLCGDSLRLSESFRLTA